MVAFPICFLSHFSNHPTQSHWQAIKKVMRYIKETIKSKLKYAKSHESLVGYLDAN
jgi:hypothetical protein